MVELDSHAAEVGQQLVGVGLLGENAERTLQSFQLARQLNVFLRLEGDDCCCRCGLEMHVHVKSHSDPALKFTVTRMYRYARNTRANYEAACQPVTKWAAGKKNNLFVLLGFSRKHHRLNIYSKYLHSHVSERMSVQEFGV